MRIGMGVDAHRLVEGRPLILGGIAIPHHKGLLGHSDADVLTHVIIDAIIGALCLGSIGVLFPDTDPQYKGISSLKLLSFVVEKMKMAGYRIGNVDTVVVAQEPKLKSHMEAMRTSLAKVLEASPTDVSVKATTTETLGFEGRQEGISAHAVVLLLPLS